MKVLGVDPGTARIGYGAVVQEKGEDRACSYGCIELKAVPEGERLRELHKRLTEIVVQEKPDVLALEQVFFSKNRKTALAVGEALGVIKLVAQQRNVATHTYTPLQVKSAVSTHGNASKQEVQKMVRLILGLEEVPEPDDAADALAAALCAVHMLWQNRVDTQ